MHPNFKHSNGINDNKSFEQKVGQSIRYFKVPSVINKEDAFDSLMSKITKETSLTPIRRASKVRRLYFTVGSVAAAACVLLFFMYSLFMVETYTGSGNHTASNVVFLPDNSRVVLADGAELKYSKLFKQRRVQLNGQAYFEVEKGNNFYVNTKQGGVLVIGTRFCVTDINNTFEVHCYEGTVGVDYKTEKIKLDNGMKFQATNNVVDVLKHKSTTHPDFAVFHFNCNNVQLNDLFTNIENYFGIKIQNQANMNEAFTGQFHTGNVEEVLDIVCTSMKLSYEVVDEDVVRIVK